MKKRSRIVSIACAGLLSAMLAAVPTFARDLTVTPLEAMDQAGNMFVNGKPLEEPYLSEKALGDCNIEFPYQVPDNRIFCMGDHRATSLDSRNTAVGCISEEQIVGKIVFRVWPFEQFGAIS